METLFLGIDFGTQGVRCGIFNEIGKLRAISEISYPSVFPQPGWAEQDPYQWIIGMEEALRKLKAKVGYKQFINIKGIGICSTASTVLPVDENSNPISNSILWMDKRACDQAKHINQIGHKVLKYCGGEVSAEWIVPKVIWIKENLPSIYNKCTKIVELQDFINHYLTGRWCISLSHAVCKTNYVEELGGFSQDFFSKIGLNDYKEKLLTDVVGISCPIEKIRPELADRYGLNKDVIIYQGAMDAYINMLGMGVCSAGNIGVVMGTSFVHMALTKSPIFIDGLWGPYLDALVPGLFCLEGGQISTGSIIKWFLKEFNINSKNGYKAMEEVAAHIKPCCDGLCVLDFFQGNRTPYKDPDASGVFYGLTLGHTRAHIYRAILESVAYGTRNIIERMENGGVIVRNIVGCGGITKSIMWLQIISDIMGKPIILTKYSQYAGVLGSAILAAVGSGYYKNLEIACNKMVSKFKEINPNISVKETYAQGYRKYLLVYENLKEMMHDAKKHQ